MPLKGQKFKHYNRDFVLEVIEEKLTTDISYAQLSKKYDIPAGTISVWVHKHTTQAWDCSDRRGKNPNQDIDYKMRYDIVKKYLTFLKEQQELR